jgi:hypothetical protein
MKFYKGEGYTSADGATAECGIGHERLGIWLYGRFWDKKALSDRDRIASIFHEMTHKYASTMDYARHPTDDDSTWVDAAGDAREPPTTSERINNAYSYEYYFTANFLQDISNRRD